MKKLIDALDAFLAEADRETIISSIQKRLQKELEDAFGAQGEALVSNLPSGGEVPVDYVWEPMFTEVAEETSGAFVEPIVAAAGASMSAGALQALADFAIGMSFDLANPRAVAYLKAHGAELVTAINDTTRDYIKTVVTNGVENGLSYGEIAKAITDRYEEFKIGKPQEHIDSRAHLIAVTEIGNAYEEGNLIVVEDLADGGLEMEKFWQTVEDARVSDGCQQNQDAGWIPAGEPFPSGDMRPLRFPGCRCAALYRRKPKK